MIIRNKVCFPYDVEVFPNFMSVTVKNSETGNIMSYEISERRNDLPEIAKLFLHKGIYFVGFNSMHYDSPIISYLIINYKRLILKPVWEITEEIKKFSDKIINSDTSASWSQYKYANLFPDLDLLVMKWSQKLRVGLKALQVTMQYRNVEEYKGDFERPLPRSEIPSLLAYNVNDVESTDELLKRSKKDIDLRIAIEDQYHISALNKDGVNLGMEILKKYYLEATGKSWYEIKDLRSKVDEVPLKDVIFDYIQFDNPTLQKVLAQLKETTIPITNVPKGYKFEIKFEIGGVKHTYGIGGLHSENDPEVFEPLDDEMLLDSDVRSLYPTIALVNKLYPAHLGEAFLNVYQMIYDQRVAAKAEGKKTENETLKLALNGLTGNLQSIYSWVYDPMMVFRIRINGQLMLLMLIEKVVEHGFQLIQSNTDGIFVKIKKDRYNEYMQICKDWETKTQLTLEHDEFERFYQYAINDYVGVKKGWSESHDPKFIKKKGLFIDEPILGKGLAPLIIPEAINKYLVEGIPPEETIKNCTDIRKFCTFQKVDKQFAVFYGSQKVTHINRYYMSMYGQMMYKQRIDNQSGKVFGPQIALCADSPVTIYNRFDDDPIETRGINYRYYVAEAYKIIEKLNDKQLTLW